MASGWSRLTGLAQAVFGGAQLIDGRSNRDKDRTAQGARITVQGIGALFGVNFPDEMADKLASEMMDVLDKKVAERTAGKAEGGVWRCTNPIGNDECGGVNALGHTICAKCGGASPVAPCS